MANSVLDFTTYTPQLSVDKTALIESCVAQFGVPLLLVDCDRIRVQYRALQQALPTVTLHFALKPLPLPAVVNTLLAEGANFDLASSGEIDLVRAQGVPAQRTIHTHPIKRDSDIRDALEYGCSVFVVDNMNELEKFIAYKNDVELLVRLSFRNSDAFADLSKKFGCSPEDALHIISRAHALGISIKGLSFHVGSQTTDPQKYVNAIMACRQLMDDVITAKLPALSTLDIGGGFPVTYNHSVLPIDEFCQPINQALMTLPETVQVLAEPGRFIVACAAMSVSSVLGQAQREGDNWYYLDDGIYGSFSGIIFDHGDYPIVALKESAQVFSSVLAGPTCDSIDVIAEKMMLPKLDNGDLIVSHMMGAYSSVTATDFNFCKRAKTVVLNEEVTMQRMLG